MQIFNYDYLLKYIIIGDSGVGKSNLLLRYTDNKFNEAHVLTLGVEFAAKNVTINNSIFRLQIWDTAGQEQFRSITRSFYKNSACVILVYDITSKDSFLNIQTWRKDCLQNCFKKVYLVLVGNKADDEANRQVTYQEGEQYAKENKMLFFESSAKLGNNVNEIFEESAQQISKGINSGLYNVDDPESGIKKNVDKEDKNIVLSDKIVPSEKKCCPIL